jgi:hypothetical protein
LNFVEEQMSLELPAVEGQRLLAKRPISRMRRRGRPAF